jgi:hypothetical protein
MKYTTPKTPKTLTDVAKIVEIVSPAPLESISDHIDHWAGLAPGIYTVHFSCPLYTMIMRVSWTGSELVA